jgi:hypothetical protein
MSKFTLDQELEIIKIKKEGILTNKEIQVKFNIKHKNTIYQIIDRGGREHIIPNKKYNVNENYFENIDTEDKAYWLGFLYADGCVRLREGGELRLKLKKSDKNHIELFNKCLNSNYPIKNEIYYAGIKKYKCESEYVNISNTKLVKDLIKQGCIQTKTFKIKFPDLNENLMNHFIRGYFDGDGCIYKVKKLKNTFQIFIAGNENFTQSLREHLSKIFNSDKILVYLKHKTYILVINNKLDCLKFKNYIYNNFITFLKRKKYIFDELVIIKN